MSIRRYHDYVVERADPTTTKPLYGMWFTGTRVEIANVAYVAPEIAVNDPFTKLPKLPTECAERDKKLPQSISLRYAWKLRA